MSAAASQSTSATTTAAAVATAVHELKNPLAVLIGFADLIEQRWDDGDRDELRAMVAVLRRNGRRIERLVEDMLLAARLDADLFPVRFEETDVLPVLTAAAEVATARGVSVEVDCPPGLRSRTDADRLEQVLGVLVENACLHGRPPVAITATARAAGISVAVSDHGDRLTPRDLDGLFDALPPAASGRRGSNGLGLYIARRIARALQGDVDYAPGDRGGSFVVAVPDGTSPSEPGAERSGSGRR